MRRGWTRAPTDRERKTCGPSVKICRVGALPGDIRQAANWPFEDHGPAANSRVDYTAGARCNIVMAAHSSLPCRLRKLIRDPGHPRLDLVRGDVDARDFGREDALRALARARQL